MSEAYWQPIDTAPKDGTPILALVDNDKVTVIVWSEAFSTWELSVSPEHCEYSDDCLENITGWSKLPDIPKPQESERTKIAKTVWADEREIDKDPRPEEIRGSSLFFEDILKARPKVQGESERFEAETALLLEANNKALARACLEATQELKSDCFEAMAILPPRSSAHCEREILRMAEPSILKSFLPKTITVKRSLTYMLLQLLKFNMPHRYEEIIDPSALPKPGDMATFRRHKPFQENNENIK